MSDSRTAQVIRVRAAAILLALVGGVALAGCGQMAEQAAEQAAGNAIGGDVDLKDGGLSITNSDGTQVQIGGNATLPASWPSALPAFEGGTLMSVTANADGSSVSAVWSTDQSPEDAVSSYDAKLQSAGFVKENDNVVVGIAGERYTGNGMTVSIIATQTGDSTTLALSGEASS